MANVFDQFDPPKEIPASAGKGNIFDRFDPKPLSIHTKPVASHVPQPPKADEPVTPDRPQSETSFKRIKEAVAEPWQRSWEGPALLGPLDALGRALTSAYNGAVVTGVEGTYNDLVDPIKKLVEHVTGKSLGKDDEREIAERDLMALPEAFPAGLGKMEVGAAKAGSRKALNALAYADPHDAVEQLVAKGASFTPNLVSKEGPTMLSKMAGAGSGKVKLSQQISEKNQGFIVNSAKEALGIGEKEQFNPSRLKQVYEDEGKAYEAVQNEIPTVLIKDNAAFQETVGQLRDELQSLDEKYPGLHGHVNPVIADFKNSLQSLDKMPMKDAMDNIRRWRSDASKYFKAADRPGSYDPMMEELGWAKRRAANAMEALIEDNLTNAPNTIRALLVDGFESTTKAQAAIADANKALAQLPAKLGTNPQEVARIKQQAGETIAEAKRTIEANEEEQKALAKAFVDMGDIETRSKLVDNFRQARQRMALAHDLELATNPVGEINGRTLALLAKKGRPFSGPMKDVVDAVNISPRDFQPPSTFGGVETFSIMDALAGTEAVASGRPEIMGLVLGRPLARKMVASRPYQESMVGLPRKKAPVDALTESIDQLTHGTGTITQ